MKITPDQVREIFYQALKYDVLRVENGFIVASEDWFADRLNEFGSGIEAPEPVEARVLSPCAGVTIGIATSLD
jgi:hypothetical protein